MPSGRRLNTEPRDLILGFLRRFSPRSYTVDDIESYTAIERRTLTYLIRSMEKEGQLFRWEIEGREWVCESKDEHCTFYIERMPLPSQAQRIFESVARIGRMEFVARTPMFRPCGDIYTDFEETYSRYRLTGLPENTEIKIDNRFAYDISEARNGGVK